MTVFLLVLTMINGSWIAEFAAGGPHLLSSDRFLSTRFLNDICCNIKQEISNKILSKYKTRRGWEEGKTFRSNL
jgi:hypothetical protein